jgi:glycerol-1-phosphatase
VGTVTADATTGAGSRALAASEGPLLSGHDLLLVDLDGVAYLGDLPISGAAEALAAARGTGVAVVFVTNNASRTPAAVAAHLTGLGFTASADEVVTSAVAAAGELSARVPAGAAVLVVGGDGVREALLAVGLRPVTGADQLPVAVMQGFSPDVGWRELAEAAVALRGGALWVATNGDPTLPSPRGPLPGNGALVAALVAATGLTPLVVGKPGPVLYEAAMREHPGSAPLAVGDRLDTDIAGARAAGLHSLLVFTGVSAPIDLLCAPAGHRPHYIGRDLRALAMRHPAARYDPDNAVARCGTTTVGWKGLTITVSVASSGQESADGLDGLRALTVLVWAAPLSIGEASSRETYLNAIDELDLD